MTNEAFAERIGEIHARVAEQGFMALVGATLDELSPGGCTISVVKRRELLQQHGFFHGGVTAFLIDNGATIAAATMMRPGQGPLTAEYKLNLLAPAAGDRLVCRARVVRPGRTMTVTAADVYSVDPEGRETHVATALATIAVLQASPKGASPAPLG